MNDIRAALKRQIDKARTPEFMARLAERMHKDKPILDRLAQTDEDTVPDRDVPPSQRDLSTHQPGCNCMGCFYADDR